MTHVYVVAYNYDGLLEFAEFSNAVKTDLVQYSPVDDVDDEGLAKLILTEKQTNAVIKQLSQVSAYLESQQISHNIRDFLKVFGGQRDTKLLYSVIPCYYGWFVVRIETDDRVPIFSVKSCGQ